MKMLRNVNSTSDHCCCKAFDIEHDEGIDGCLSNEEGPFCGSCGQPSETETEDVGFGPGEFWGSKYSDIQIIDVSICCGDLVFRDPSLTLEC